MRTLRILAIRAILATLAIGVCAIAIRSAIAQTPQPWPTPFPQVSPTPQMVPSGDVCEEPLIDGSMQMIFVVDASDEVALPLSGTVDCSVYWGDCSTASVATEAGDVSHTYAKAGTYTVQIDGDLTSFGDGATWTGADALTSVTTFGTVGITALPGAFYGATSLTALPESVSGVTDISDILHDATAYNGTELATWDITSLTDASNALDGCGLEPDHYNQIIMSWADQVATNSDLPASITLGADGLWWGNAEYADLTHADTDTARTYLEDTASWTITGDKEAMVLVFDTSLETGTTVELPLLNAIDCTVYWGDGTSDSYVEANSTTNKAHTWSAEGEYTTYVTGSVNTIGKRNWLGVKKLISARSFGDLTSYVYAFLFYNATNITHIPAYLPPTVGVITDILGNLGDINGTYIANVENWDVGNISPSAVGSRGGWSGATFAETRPTTNITLLWDFDLPAYINGFMYGSNNNIDVRGMNVSNVAHLGSAFRDNASFNQNLGSWQLRTAGVEMGAMLNNCGMDTLNYALTLTGWANYVAQDTLPANVTLGAANVTYGAFPLEDYADSTFTCADSAKAFLVDVAGWSITDGGCEGASCGE